MLPSAAREEAARKQKQQQNKWQASSRTNKKQQAVLLPSAARNEAARKQKQQQNKRQASSRTNKKSSARNNSKGLVEREEDWLLTDRFVQEETRASAVSDGGSRDDNGFHHLGSMELECCYCCGLGFHSENRGSKDKPHFGALCCSQGKVKGIRDYNLPEDLKILYTSGSDLARHFRKHARTYNNGMAMSSLTAKNGWRSRAHGNKTESMLTAGGQLLRRVGSLCAADGETPKCVQTYFFGGEEATKWRMKGIKRSIPNREQATYKSVFEKLHKILTEKASNRYLESYLGVKDYVETHLKDKVWDVKLSIHANHAPSETM